MFRDFDFGEFTAKRIASLQKDKNISARELSLVLGQSSHYISKIEKGDFLPSLQSLFYICEYFEMEPKEFFDTEPNDSYLLSQLMKLSKQLDKSELDRFIQLISSNKEGL